MKASGIPAQNREIITGEKDLRVHSALTAKEFQEVICLGWLLSRGSAWGWSERAAPLPSPGHFQIYELVECLKAIAFPGEDKPDSRWTECSSLNTAFVLVFGEAEQFGTILMPAKVLRSVLPDVSL